MKKRILTLIGIILFFSAEVGVLSYLQSIGVIKKEKNVKLSFLSLCGKDNHMYYQYQDQIFVALDDEGKPLKCNYNENTDE